MISKLFRSKKNTRFVFIALVLFVSTQFICLSQGKTSIGVKAGAGFSRYFFILTYPYDQEGISQSYVPVFQTGLVFSQTNEKNLGIQIEVNYIQKGWEQKFDDQDITYNVLMDNIEVPFLSHFRFGKKRSGWVLNMGLHFSYAFNVKVDSAGTSIKLPLIDYKGLGYTPFDYGLDGAVGYEIGKDKSAFLIQLMFSQGLRNYIDREDQNPLKIYRSLNQSLFLSCIYTIPIFNKKAIKPD